MLIPVSTLADLRVSASRLGLESGNAIGLAPSYPDHHCLSNIFIECNGRTPDEDYWVRLMISRYDPPSNPLLWALRIPYVLHRQVRLARTRTPRTRSADRRVNPWKWELFPEKRRRGHSDEISL